MRSPCSTTAPSPSSGPASIVAWYGRCVSHTISTASSAAARRVTGRVRTRRSAYLEGGDTGVKGQRELGAGSEAAQSSLLTGNSCLAWQAVCTAAS